jgi:vacuole morphology and inheritance protein 14
MSRNIRKPASPEPVEPLPRTPNNRTPEPLSDEASSDIKTAIDFDYEAAVNALTLQFLHEHEATRVAALAWLIMLHRKSPRRILAIHAGTFPALLKTLSDPAEAVVTRDLLLLSQISKNSDESYFTSFMQNLLSLFCTDRSLLQSRGNLIIRQLCTSLSAERIYRTLSDILITTYDTEEDIEFATLMVQNLNNNLITAPELADLRKRLRQLDSSKDSQTFFTVLFKAWCGNAVATFSLCLLAQAYEQAYNLLQVFADMEMTVNTLIQIDKLVQLLESPVFTYLRMQLLEPERFPHLYKCMYGLLMLLPQSSAFAALKNRLNSVSAIGYLHIAPRTGGVTATTPSSVSTFERQNRLKSRDEGGIKWAELLEKFRSTQDRVRRAQLRQLNPHIEEAQAETEILGKVADSRPGRRPLNVSTGPGGLRPNSVTGFARNGQGQGIQSPNLSVSAGAAKNKVGGLGHLGRLAGGVAGKGKAKK